MTFRIIALDPAPFVPLFALSDAELAACNARRVTATENPGFPCRVSLVDAALGETLILANYAHLSGPTPYASTHAVYVRPGAQPAQPAPGEIPEVLARRLLSVRAFDVAQMMIDADVVDGRNVASHLEGLFARAEVDFVHLHNAKPGCFAAAAVRA